MAKRDYRKGELPFEFQPIPKAVLRSAEFQALPSSAKALMLDLMAQYTGKNNGRLCCAFEALQAVGWSHKHTLARAKEHLLECSFARLTRKGRAPRTAEWLGFTWWKLDWQESMEIPATGWPYLNFMLAEVKPAKPTKQQLYARWSAPPTDGRSEVQKVLPLPPKTGSGGAESAPIEPESSRSLVQKVHHAT